MTVPKRVDPSLLDEQIAYYRAIAPEYEHHMIDQPGADELKAAFQAFQPQGDVLELACGPGMWTAHLQKTARSVTAVDASPEMIARARARSGEGNVRFVQADLFQWRADRRYDAVFFGFWLSHVPLDRFDDFWARVADALLPGARVLFVDDAYRTPEELIEGADSPVIQRRLKDGTAHRAIKVEHRAAELEARLRALGWDIRVTQTAGPFYWGLGTRGR